MRAPQRVLPVQLQHQTLNLDRRLVGVPMRRTGMLYQRCFALVPPMRQPRMAGHSRDKGDLNEVITRRPVAFGPSIELETDSW